MNKLEYTSAEHLKIGQTVFWMESNSVMSGKVETAEIKVQVIYGSDDSESYTSVMYKARKGLSAGYRFEFGSSDIGKKVFASKEELLNSL